jgi:hypothetical protein
MLSLIREMFSNPFPLKLVSSSKQLDFENRTSGWSPEVWRETGLSEKNRTILAVGGAEFKLEMAADTGLIAKVIARRKLRIGRCGGGRGTGVEPSPRRPRYSSEFWRTWFLAKAGQRPP